MSLAALIAPVAVRARPFKGTDVDPSLETVVILDAEGGAPKKKVKMKKPAGPPLKF